VHEVTKPETTAAVTDVSEFMSDLDGGQLERKLSVALSQTAAAVIDNGRAGEVKLIFSFKRIEGTHQVALEHKLIFARPTLDGKATEEEKRVTVMHVGKFGRLTLVPESQIPLLDRQGQPTN
jgi:hypothetical protein